jgi:hypothetical protein
VLRDKSAHEGWILEGRRTDHDARHARAQRLADVGFVPKAAGDLDPSSLPHGSDDPDGGVHVSRDADPCAIEVDHVEPSRSGFRESRGDDGRFIVVHGLAAEISLAQPDDAATSKVDRGQNLKCPCDGHGSMLS